MPGGGSGGRTGGGGADGAGGPNHGVRPGKRPDPAALGSARRRGRPPRLAARAEEGRAPALDDPLDGGAAGQAGLARAIVDEEPVAVGAWLVPQRAVHAEGGAGARDRLVQDRADLLRDRLPLG